MQAGRCSPGSTAPSSTRMLAENDAATKRADAAIDQARSLIEQSQAQLEFADRATTSARRSSAPA